MCFTVELSKEKLITKDFRWRCASGKHPYPIPNTTVKTEAADDTMLETALGKAGGCREPPKKRSRGKGDEITNGTRKGVNPHQRGSAVWIAGFTSDYEDIKSCIF